MSEREGSVTMQSEEQVGDQGEREQIWRCYPAAFEDERRGPKEESRWPLEAKEGKETDSPLQLSEGIPTNIIIFGLLSS